MTVSSRRCKSCFWFLPGPTKFTGRCAHPNRQLDIGPQPWVRERELPCRSDWEHDLWEPGEQGEDDWLVDIHMLDPNGQGPGPGFNPPNRNVLQLLLVLPDLPLVPDFQEEFIGEEILCAADLARRERGEV